MTNNEKKEQIATSIFPQVLKMMHDRTAQRISFSNITDDEEIDIMFDNAVRKAASKSILYAEIFIQEINKSTKSN